MHVRIPEAHEQTDPRHALGFWVGQLTMPKLLTPGDSERSRWGVWLLRDPNTMFWGGVVSEVPSDADPAGAVLSAFDTTIGRRPRYLDLVRAIQPDEQPNVHYTSFVYTAVGAVANQSSLPCPQPSQLELGLFPLGELPENMDPSQATWLNDTLTAAIGRGLSSARMECIPRD